MIAQLETSAAELKRDERDHAYGQLPPLCRGRRRRAACRLGKTLKCAG